jgi:ribosomal protein L37E
VGVSRERRCGLGGYFERVVGVAPCAFPVSKTRRDARACDQMTQNQIAEHRGSLNFLAAVVEALVGFSQAVGIAATQQNLGESEVEISSPSTPPGRVAIATCDEVSR